MRAIISFQLELFSIHIIFDFFRYHMTLNYCATPPPALTACSDWRRLYPFLISPMSDASRTRDLMIRVRLGPLGITLLVRYHLAHVHTVRAI